MLNIRWQRAPLDSGAHLVGGRYNPPGMAALYLALDHATAIAEYHQGFVRPGVLAGYDVEATMIADLTKPGAGLDHVLACNWRTISQIEAGRPPSWTLAEDLVAAGADGSLVPSIQRPGGVNLVLWRWNAADPRVTLIDPTGDLQPPS